MDVAKIIEEITNTITIADIICLPGVVLLGIWLLRTSWGRKALADSVPRRNNMPVYLPFAPLFIWFGAVSGAIWGTERLLADLPDWQKVFLDNFFICLGALVAMVVVVFLARRHFARQLKGFGLDPRTIVRDFFAGLVNLLAVWPLVLSVLMLTILIGRLVWGQDFQMEQHEELELITAHSQLPVRVLIIVTAVVVVPVFEEMLFRGLFQTMIRSVLEMRNSKSETRNKTWLAIIVSSGLFAMVHSHTGHWPALFVLSMGMGYAYEKSGSLLRPIFIHSAFNAASIIAVLNQ